MDVNFPIEHETLERYALDKLDKQQTDVINTLLGVNLELGEALEMIYIKLEKRGDL